MKTRGIFLGIDFGTSNSSVAYIFADPRDSTAKKLHVETVRFTEDDEGRTSERVPTVLSANFDDRRKKEPLLGWDFISKFRQPKKNAELLRHGQSFFRSVKSDLGSFRVYPHAFAADYNTPEKVAAAVIRHLRAGAKAALSGYDISCSHVVITVPASLSAVAREHTLEAARLAGFDPQLVELIDEPVAALLDFVNDGRAAGLLEEDVPKNLLVFDYGGGTLDLSLVRARFDAKSKSGVFVENLAISRYRRLGGDDVDRAIMEDVIWPQIEKHLGTDKGAVRGDVRQMVVDTLTPTLARRLKENLCRRIAARASGRSGGGKKGEVAIEPIRSFELPEMTKKLPSRFTLSEAEFEEVMERFVAVPDGEPDDDWECECPESLLVPVLEVLHSADLSSSELDALILHGGSCRNPLVRDMIESTFAEHADLFGTARVCETPSLDASVARGAAIACYWRHARGEEIVPPIIAEEIGILTLNEQAVPLVPSGKPLPFPNEHSVHAVQTDFYVPRTGAREMRVPVYTGLDHRLAHTVRVPLPPNSQKGDPVQIRLRVEKDKTLRWWFSVGGGDFLAAEQLHNPWTMGVPTPAERRLQEHRRQIRGAVLGGAPVSHWAELDEAQCLYDARMFDEAEVALQDYMNRYGPAGRAANLMALICGQFGRKAEELQWFERAMKLAPGEAVFKGNYGYVLADHGRMDEAEAQIRAALSMDPTLRYLYTRLGDMYRERGDEAAAQREYREAIRLVERDTGTWPESVNVWRAAEGLYRRVAEYEKAADARRRATTIERNERLGGDHAASIAGPDSGFLSLDDAE